MSGNQYQYDPSEMFKEWIRKSGKAQSEFIKNFGMFMGNQSSQEFDPVQALKQVTDKATETQTNLMKNFASMQSKGMDNMFNLTQIMPNFMNWGAYKTSVGSNGRISIPEAERDALGLKEGDLVQVIVLPLEKKSKNREVKK
ncbi:MAG TPA: AbrB/MazE/SpoVT family DNA-binding domain-containing protein [Nitrosopumilaceae archaeon]|nr:AbrB/MazE/SpoVT family DNA-binding domain-containing protein [Nitrosopumilaceae archaeon]